MSRMTAQNNPKAGSTALGHHGESNLTWLREGETDGLKARGDRFLPALFIALGGTAMAIQGRRSVKADDLATGAVTARALAKGAVHDRAIRAQAIDTRELARQAVGRDRLKPQAVNTQGIANGTIQAEDLGRLLRVPVANNQGIVAGVASMRLKSPRLEWAGTESGAAPSSSKPSRAVAEAQC